MMIAFSVLMIGLTQDFGKLVIKIYKLAIITGEDDLRVGINEFF